MLVSWGRGRSNTEFIHSKRISWSSLHCVQVLCDLYILLGEPLIKDGGGRWWAAFQKDQREVTLLISLYTMLSFQKRTGICVMCKVTDYNCHMQFITASVSRFTFHVNTHALSSGGGLPLSHHHSMLHILAFSTKVSCNLLSVMLAWILLRTWIRYIL